MTKIITYTHPQPFKIVCPCCGEKVEFYAKGLEKYCPSCGTLVKS